jgi:hypothetical protein
VLICRLPVETIVYVGGRFQILVELLNSECETISFSK